MGNVTYTKLFDKLFTIGGNRRMAVGTLRMSNSYATGGDAFDPTDPTIVGFTAIAACLLEQPSGYILEFINATKTIKAYYPSGSPTLSGEAAHTHGVLLDAGASAAGASHNHVFTGSELATHQHAAITAGTPAGTVAIPVLNIATDAFTGTGITASGQVMTTTDNQTMTLNQCAGMWLYPVTGATPPVLILSNTAVTGAPAVFTVQGGAFTNAGVYHVIRNTAPAFTGSALATHIHDVITAGTPAGTNAAEATHTHAWGTLADTASAGGSSHTHTATAEVAEEVAALTDLSGLIGVRVVMIGV